ncbi:hypothetical protein EMIHUDRAFT_240758 [Emiliania huxleyi CCMP1516]|uniref:Uncharacterized protein n=2 Tax=Emiliania huxleyi TaxID=2903 RepID=A0A0D3JEI2_EMIH1|nr:hypothetical protein EMIHUDRAFT_212645 [Emiliania huxleyi CCMP1516]XP_005774346.1 hypothetical protein EMIHUDRAFT_240758 [Emiliania huxleyi CCMP1516]EOD13538.1 hypothetical protein EMIHUDRAFT_212645 [Emiliania huxleyi CCMP1516]EOD21917.1 hypothetical protein EMIHUDRAFT_240758 [Emiliania huxleyi CCMP1516]|eukprot:XP_005765967.1 hypothetical protein EMIHUDRAFT_212645 [Emiliania huxleyi CCMP1516]
MSMAERRATGTSVATVTTSLAAVPVELCDEDVAMRCSAQSDAGSAADPEWEAVLAQLLAEEAEEEKLCCRFERRGDDSDDGWDNYSEEEEDAAVQGVAEKVDESLERRDERACATGGGFSMLQAAPTLDGPGPSALRWEAEDLGDYDLLNPSSAARRKQVLLEEGWPRGELPSKVGLREHMQARAALRYKGLQGSHLNLS